LNGKELLPNVNGRSFSARRYRADADPSGNVSTCSRRTRCVDGHRELSSTVRLCPAAQVLAG
jgi:hypothetical protein